MKSAHLRGWLLMAVGGVLGLLSLAAFTSLVRALLVPNTLAAIESAFGSLVVALLLLVLANRAWRAGQRRLGPKKADSGLQRPDRPL